MCLAAAPWLSSAVACRPVCCQVLGPTPLQVLAPTPQQVAPTPLRAVQAGLPPRAMRVQGATPHMAQALHLATQCLAPSQWALWVACQWWGLTAPHRARRSAAALWAGCCLG
jgi:hypothetical protein